MNYVEEREFTLRFELRCEFPEDYEGDADGYEWVKDFPAIAAEILQSAAAIIRKRHGLGRAPDQPRPSHRRGGHAAGDPRAVARQLNRA